MKGYSYWVNKHRALNTPMERVPILDQEISSQGRFQKERKKMVSLSLKRMTESCPSVIEGEEYSRNRKQYKWNNQNLKELWTIPGAKSGFQSKRLQTSLKQWEEEKLQKVQMPGHYTALYYSRNLWN